MVQKAVSSSVVRDTSFASHPQKKAYGISSVWTEIESARLYSQL